jgi:hypothetical protein
LYAFFGLNEMIFVRKMWLYFGQTHCWATDLEMERR